MCHFCAKQRAILLYWIPVLASSHRWQNFRMGSGWDKSFLQMRQTPLSGNHSTKALEAVRISDTSGIIAVTLRFCLSAYLSVCLPIYLSSYLAIYHLRSSLSGFLWVFPNILENRETNTMLHVSGPLHRSLNCVCMWDVRVHTHLFFPVGPGQHISPFTFLTSHLA